MSRATNFPRQKLSDSKKNDKWHKECVDFGESLLHDTNLRASHKNKQVNLDLAVNKIDRKDFERIINPDNLPEDTIPAEFKHIGVENNKINLLVGEYSKRKTEDRLFLSANDVEGISRKDKERTKLYYDFVVEQIKSESLNEEALAEGLKSLKKYDQYDFQDLSEIIANRILKKEMKENNYKLLFMETFESLLRVGEQIMYIDVLGGKPVMRMVDPRKIYVYGSNTRKIEDSDVICAYDFKSPGQLIDDYWDKLKDSDIKKLEDESTKISDSYNRVAPIPTSSTDEDCDLKIIPNQLLVQGIGDTYYDAHGNIRELITTWRSRRKIGKRKYYVDGEVEYDWVNENYKIDEFSGEEIEWKWVNEWRKGVKLGKDIYLDLGVIKFASKSMTNKSKGLPNYIGTYGVHSMTDYMKPLSYSYDIAYYKRDLEIATHVGSFAAINASMIPSGWNPEQWIRYAKINKFAFLDPTNEILKGPSQGKSAGAYNTITAASVQMDNSATIQMYTNLLFDIEQTLGKISGVTGAREGQIQNREAVNNVEREVTQTSHITEKWFQKDADFRKRVLLRFVDACKHAYKDNPTNGQFVLDDLSTEYVSNYDEFTSSEYDLHVSDGTEDTRLYDNIMSLMQPAIQNGQATIADAITLFKAESVQEVSKKLEISSIEAQQRSEAMQQKQLESNEKTAQIQATQAKEAVDWEKEKFYAELEDRKDQTSIKREKVFIDADGKERDRLDRVDTNFNGIADDIDKKILDNQKLETELDNKINEGKLAEDVRHNKATEEISRLKLQIDKAIKKSTS
jgi:hypothetical protein